MMRSHTILCVDDEALGLQIRKAILEMAGYRVLTALDGSTALGLFERNPIDVVVLDYLMPEMDGGQVAIMMRQTKPSIPILLLSAYVDLSVEVTASVDLYMTKGEGAPVLLEKLGSLLQPVGTSHE